MYIIFVKYMIILFPASYKNYIMEFEKKNYCLCRVLANNKS